MRIIDRVSVVAALLGAMCVLVGLVPVGQAAAIGARLAPLMVFLLAVVVFADLLTAAGVFDTLAAVFARAAGGSYPLLFLYTVLLTSATTIVLNLDTTAVLLTPVLIALAQRLEAPALPLAMTAAWLANTASLLLPVSNLTNLLAADRLQLTPVEFAGRLWLPQLAAVLATAVMLWLLHWRREVAGARRYRIAPPPQPPHRGLYRVGAVTLSGFTVAVVAGMPLAAAAVVAAVLLTAATWRWRPAVLTWRLVAWRPVAFVAGLFLVVAALGNSAVSRWLAASDSTAGTAVSSALLANAINNLPSYAAMEPGASDPRQLLAVLIGTNVAAIVTPWASLAIILWADRCRAAGVEISWRRFMATGALAAPVVVAASLAGYHFS